MDWTSTPKMSKKTAKKKFNEARSRVHVNPTIIDYGTEEVWAIEQSILSRYHYAVLRAVSR